MVNIKFDDFIRYPSNPVEKRQNTLIDFSFNRTSHDIITNPYHFLNQLNYHKRLQIEHYDDYKDVELWIDGYKIPNHASLVYWGVKEGSIISIKPNTNTTV